MEEHYDTMQILSYSLLPCVLFLLLSTKFFLHKRNKRNLPPSPFALPIIGHLHLLKLPIHRTLDSLSKKYGPIFSLQLGSYLAVVVSSPSIVEECFTKNDIALANRPRFLAGRHLLNYNNSDMGSVDYGDHWRNLRRISALEIFSTSRLTSLFSIRRDEVNILTRRLYSVSSHDYAKVELRSMFFDLTSNVIMRMVAGKRYYGEDVKETVEARLFREILKDFIGYIAMIQVGDMIPIFAEQQPEYYTDDIIKGHILVMMIGGTETGATAMEWALANLLNHPRVLKKAKTELDTQVGDHLIEESDFEKLQYLRCIISETLQIRHYGMIPQVLTRRDLNRGRVGAYNFDSIWDGKESLSPGMSWANRMMILTLGIIDTVL
ncbi:P450 FAMILY 81 SUBFAMILY D POLYPEPTIDE 8 putative-RELATED [Salix viminalis]|uniref:P450 FAMILY 81 SUBFAMILY D POLYPEPTIDE 8 putative-RELATED n=1 Tax=Salix viminalis TaxID=40686 RepID=A0A9Q0YZH3_SALVM|nr:P450 FAMILY 81 SUBFAMILY D POLYPEPTIDE 8 putative-RELATED [Salix viminalis]